MSSYGIQVIDDNGNDLWDSDGLRSTLTFIGSSTGGSGQYTLQDGPTLTWMLDFDFYLPSTLSVIVQLSCEVQWDGSVGGNYIALEYIELWLDNQADTQRTGANAASAPIGSVQLNRSGSAYVPVALGGSAQLSYLPDAQFPGWHTAAMIGYTSYTGGESGNYMLVRSSQVDVWQLGG